MHAVTCRLFRMKLAGAAFILCLFISCGCESATVSDSWRDPTFTSPIRFKRTLVMAMTSDVIVRRMAENQMVAELGEGRSIQAHKLLNESDRYDVEHLVQKLTPNGVDGIVAMRLVST